MEDARRHIQKRRAEIERARAEIDRAQAELDDELKRLEIAEAVIDEATGTKGKTGQLSVKDVLVKILKEKSEVGEEGATLDEIDKFMKRRGGEEISKRYLSVALSQLKANGKLRLEEGVWSLIDSNNEDE